MVKDDGSYDANYNRNNISIIAPYKHSVTALIKKLI